HASRLPGARAQSIERRRAGRAGDARCQQVRSPVGLLPALLRDLGRAARRRPSTRMSTPKYQQVAAIVREQITDGTLAPGAPAPSGTALSLLTGYSALTCRR